MTFGEDQIEKGYAPQILAGLGNCEGNACHIILNGKPAVKCTRADDLGAGPLADCIAACVNAFAGHDTADVARGLKLLRLFRELRDAGNFDAVSGVRLHAAENHP